ncbi:MAG: trigger factor, partial [Leptolyngbyaceae bacterium]|nr:trigger factor [Leptolyngbyaceae bacterium]
FQVELTEGRFIPGFIDGILGMNLGETKEISVQFPADYAQEDLADQPAIFTITLKELNEKELPELDDDFAQQVSEFATLAELRATLESRVNEEAERKTKANKEKAFLDELLKHVEIDLPETLVEQEVDYMLTQFAMQLQNQGIDFRKLLTSESLPMMRKSSRPDAIDRIKRTITLGEIAKRENIQVDPAALTARVNELLEEYGDREIDPERLRGVIEEEMLKDKILEWLEANSTLELVPEGSLTPEVEESSPEELEAAIEVEAEAVESEVVEAEFVSPAAEAEAP